MLTRRLAIGLLVAMPLVMTGCGDSIDVVKRDQEELMQEYLGILKSIKDDASAKEAAEKINGLFDRSYSIAKRIQALQTPANEAEMKKLLDGTGKMVDPTSSTAIAVSQEMARVRKDGFGPIINAAVTKFNRAGI